MTVFAGFVPTRIPADRTRLIRETEQESSQFDAEDFTCFDRVRTAHNISSNPFRGSPLLHLPMWSQITFVFLTVRIAVRQLLILVNN